MTFTPQVEASHYFQRRYLYKERWVNYWYQIEAVLGTGARQVLEIGVGNGVVADMLKKLGILIETVDIDPALSPTHIASVTALPFADGSYELVLCAEVLEHLPYEESMKALREVYRVSKTYALITLPHAGYTFSCLWKLPLFRWQSWGFKLPHFWKTHRFNGQHYWELGKRGFSKKRLARAMRDVGFEVLSVTFHPDDPGHVFYMCKKK